MHERWCFGVWLFSLEAVSFHGRVGDLDKSGKLIAAYWALQGNGIRHGTVQ